MAGITRKIDDLGRVNIPVEIRRRTESDKLEVIVGDSGKIILKEYHPECVICGEDADGEFKNKPICDSCREEANGVCKE